MITTLVHPRALATSSAPAAVACTTGTPWPEDAQLREAAMHGIRRPYLHKEMRPRGTSPD